MNKNLFCWTPFNQNFELLELVMNGLKKVKKLGHVFSEKLDSNWAKHRFFKILFDGEKSTYNALFVLIRLDLENFMRRRPTVRLSSLQQQSPVI